MTTFVFDDGFFSVNAVDLSDHVRSISFPYGAESVDPTAMGADTRLTKGGLKTWTMTAEFNQDFDAAKVDATLFPLVGVDVALIARADKTAGVSATNPNFTGTGVLMSYEPLSGNVGEMAVVSVTFEAAGTLTRAVA